MSTEKDRKALKAFWCMFDNANRDDRKVTYLSDSISIWANKKEGNGVIGKIEAVEKEVLIDSKRFLGFTISETYDIVYRIYGEVVNTKDSNTFHFSFEGNEVAEIKQKIEKLIQDNSLREKEKKEDSLNSLIC